MENCLVLKLKEAVDNDSLRRVGEMRIKTDTVDNPTSDTQKFRIRNIDNAPLKLEIVNNTGYFTDSTLSQNLGTSLTVTNLDFYVSPGSEIAITNKYNLMEVNGFRTSHVANQTINLSEFDYSSVSSIQIMGPGVTGNISDLSKLGLTILSLVNTSVEGSIEDLPLDTLTSIRITGKNHHISGDIGVLQNSLVKSVTLLGSNYTVSGDLSKLPASTEFVNVEPLLGNYTWESTRPASSNMFSLYGYFPAAGLGVNFGDTLDAYLSNIANCAHPNSDIVINVQGTATENTPSLISALKTMLTRAGDKLRVNGVVY